MSNDLCKFPHKLTTAQSSPKYQTKQKNSTTKPHKQTNPTPWVPIHLKNSFREDVDLMTMWGSSLTAEILLFQLQYKINVGTETKNSGLKLKLKIQAKE